MKKVLALVIVVIMLASMANFALAAEVPAELSTAFAVGNWPLAAGSYDPALDGQGIPDGATIYGLFDAAYAVIDPPASLTGYEQVDAIADLAEGKWFLLVGSSGFNYVILSDGGGGAAAPDTGVIAAPDVDVSVEEVPEVPAEEPAAPPPAAASKEVYVTIVAAGAVQVAAQPVTPKRMTLDGAVEAAHDLFYEGGAAAGFVAGIDPTYNMLMITKVWGVDGNTYQAVNNDTAMGDAPLKAGDSVICSASGAPYIVTIKAVAGVEPDTLDVKATTQTLDFTTFSYTPGGYADQEVKDTAGNVLAVTAKDGTFTIAIADIPEDGVVIVGTDTAINLLTSVTKETPLDTNAKTVYVSVSVNSQFAISGISKIAALPVTVTKTDDGDERTLEGVIKKAHATYYSSVPGELQGYDAGTFWGISGAKPRILFNDKEVQLADAASIEIDNYDNIVLALSSDPRVTPELVWIDYFINGSIAIGNVYTLNPDGTKTVRVGAPLVGGDGEGTLPSTALTDPNGSVLETNGVVTDEKGYFEVTLLPGDRDGILAVAGLTASNTNKSGYYPLFKGPDGRDLVICLVVGLGAAVPLFAIVIYAQHNEIKNRGLKFSRSKIGSAKLNG
ncbi:MAG: hypothetical protein LBN00_09290 [Oscillospiraceae bacterium]|jgi:hypothetical protein|nr:hypothetical protein [Oscillospiraceae bacterium]